MEDLLADASKMDKNGTMNSVMTPPRVYCEIRKPASCRLAGLVVLLAGLTGSAASGAPDSSDRPKPVSHTTRDMEGWTVRVDDRLLQPDHAAEFARAQKFLEAKLFDIKFVVAPDILPRLQKVNIVLDLTHGKLHAMQYHPSADWLAQNGYATNLVKCFHIPDVADLVTVRNIHEQPWVIMHELAHAYHDQVLGFDEPRIRKAYEDFKKSGRGDTALLYDGSRVRHYGLTDHKEFFAEMTEAYFGMNDFFPFNRAELMTAEPEIFELLQAIWGPIAGRTSVSAKNAGKVRPPPISGAKAATVL